MSKKPNTLLAQIEERYRRAYEIKLEEARNNFIIQLRIGLQQCADAALMAADAVFDVNAYSAEKFNTAHIEFMNKIAHMVVVEDKDDPDMWWTKDTVDRKLRQIVGEENFQPWEERYGFINEND